MEIASYKLNEDDNADEEATDSAGNEMNHDKKGHDLDQDELFFCKLLIEVYCIV